ncbi:MAG: hypothetical protein ACLPT4_09405 [Verrucomicrobiia bacterium]
MLDLAISVDTDSGRATVIETNRGVKLKAPRWPQDCDFQLVAFAPSGKNCEVIWTENLAEDIGRALMSLDRSAALKGRKPDWYLRLKRCAKGADSPGDHQLL